jgi:membrane-associated protein
VDAVLHILRVILNIQTYLPEIIKAHGSAAYAAMSLVVFAETGLVFVPFLPGDSLLFVAGSLVAVGAASFPWLVLFLVPAAILGDTVNYWIGHYVGEKILASPRMGYIRRHHHVAKEFFDRHGGKTIILARFIPYIRSFAPFVAGGESMRYRWFLGANVIGAALWVPTVATAGYLFGNIPFIKNNFGLFMVCLIPMPFFPGAIAWIRKIMSVRRAKRK